MGSEAFNEYDEFDAVALAGLVAVGEVQPLNLVETVIGRRPALISAPS